MRKIAVQLLKFGQVVQEMLFKDISNFSVCSHFVLRSRQFMQFL